MAPRPSFRRRERIPGSQKTPISDLRVSRASAKLLWPTSSHLVSPAALTPSPGGATARGSRGSPAPKSSEALLDREKKGPGVTDSRRASGGDSISSGLDTVKAGHTAEPFLLELQAPRIAPRPVSVSLGSHLLLNCTCHGKSISGPHLPRANVSQVDKIHWFPNHGPVNPSPLLLRLGFLHHAAAQFVPKFTHVP